MSTKIEAIEKIASPKESRRYRSTLGMTREDWLRDRKNYVGASEVAAIIGLDSYRSPLDVWKKKVYNEESEVSEELRQRAAFGTRAEDFVAEWLSEKYGLKVRKDNKIRIHPEHPFFCANLDRVIVGRQYPGVLEIKTTSRESLKSWSIYADDINPVFMHHWCQVQAQLAVSGYTWGAIGVLPSDSFRGFGEPELIEIKRDDDFIKLMIEQIVDFWTLVLSETPPPAKTVSDLLYLHPKAGPPPIEASEETFETIKQLKILKTQISLLQKEETALSDQIKILFGESDEMIFKGETLATFKNGKDKVVFDAERFEAEREESQNCKKEVIDVKAVEEKYPDLFAEYTNKLPGDRRFYIKLKL